MPDQNQTDPNQGSPIPASDPGGFQPPVQPITPTADPMPPAFSAQPDLPPLPPDFQNVPTIDTQTPPINPISPADEQPTNKPINEPLGSAAPSDIPPIVSGPKKKFGGGKMIATILGILVLVGGVGAGILLTQQPQLFQQKAGSVNGCSPRQDLGTAALIASANATCNGDVSKNACCLNSSVCIWSGTGADACGAAVVPPPIPPGDDGGGVGASCSGGIADGKIGCLDGATGLICRNGAFNQDRLFCPQGQKCVNGADPDGFCTTNGCDNKQCCFANSTFVIYACGTTHTYKCSNSSCVQDDDTGTFTTNNCGGTCTSGGGGGGGSGWPPNATSCNKVGSGTGTIGGCAKYLCPAGCGSDGKCGEGDLGVVLTFGSCSSSESSISSSNYCGQVDTVDTNNAYCIPSGGYKDSYINCGGSCINPPTTPPTAPPTAPSCIAVSTYSSSWVAIPAAEQPSLTAGTTINFCVAGSTPSGTFDKARFTINGTTLAETTAIRPGSTDFCQIYEIPEGTTTFNVSAEIHHATEGWF